MKGNFWLMLSCVYVVVCHNKDAEYKTNNTVFENHQNCRIFQFWHFPPIFGLLKVICLGTLNSTETFIPWIPWKTEFHRVCGKCTFHKFIYNKVSTYSMENRIPLCCRWIIDRRHSFHEFCGKMNSRKIIESKFPVELDLSFLDEITLKSWKSAFYLFSYTAMESCFPQ